MMHENRFLIRLTTLIGVVLFLVGVMSTDVMAQSGVAAASAEVAGASPFPPLSQAEQQRLQQLLLAWQTQSQSTKTLECEFRCWHYDMFAAPAGVHWKSSRGDVKYAAPDKGLFKVTSQFFFDGIKEAKPQYVEKPGKYGEHWVCTGTELYEFDHEAKECKVQQLPPEMQGKNIIESPLPFVFNLDAQKIQQRYWVREAPAPNQGIILIEAYPKQQQMRAQYRLVQIALNDQTFLPQALILYAPNFDAKKAPKWDHYEFTKIKRNGIGQGMAMLMRNFIDVTPPPDYKVFKDRFQPAVPAQPGTNGAPQQVAGETIQRR
ncbi:MAG: TIGR03009 domain-containing protein [Planctomycetota bacterium]